MKAEIKQEVSVKKPEYPHLAISQAGRIVLFTAPARGMQLCNLNGGMGHSSDCWATEDFTPLDGSITLSN